MEKEKNLMTIIVLLVLTLLWSILMWMNTKMDVESKDIEILELSHQVDSLEILSDSLKVELFPAEVELTRYQVSYEIFMKRNPKAASQFGDIITNETE